MRSFAQPGVPARLTLAFDPRFAGYQIVRVGEKSSFPLNGSVSTRTFGNPLI
jgi:hypothetical protein